MRTSDFFYNLPEASIAQTPVEPRHSARLLDTRDMSDRVFSDLPGMLRSGDLLVVNRTRVRAARLRGVKTETGGAVEVLLLSGEADGTWDVLMRPSRRIRVGMQIDFAGGLGAVVTAAPEGGRGAIAFPGVSGSAVEAAIEEIGEVPLPPYIRVALEDPDRYQTVYAERAESAAAPTAGLHFSPRVLSDLEERGVDKAYIDLRVGLDTFRPIAADRIEDHRMHTERVTVSQETCRAIADTRRSGGRVVAVGTTVVRSLESAADAGGLIEEYDGPTDLFIRPGYEFRVVDGLVTNFHVPGSTLVVLIAAVLGDRWKDVYQVALDRGYRFLSFGDAMYAAVERV